MGVNQDKDVRLEAGELEAAMRGEAWRMYQETVDALNAARDGAIIADSEMIVRDALARFRQKVYERAVQLKADKAAAAAFSPSAQCEGRAASEQGQAGRELSDGQRHDSD